VVRNYVILSGENLELARAEVISLVNLINPNANVIWHDSFGLIESRIDVSIFLLNRAALVKESGPVLAESFQFEELFESLSNETFSSCLDKSKSFCFRTYSLNQEIRIDRQKVTIEFGTKIKNITNASVSLRNPDVNLTLFIGSNHATLCLSNQSTLRTQLRERKPGRKQFFHPSMMNSQLARVMCNLAAINETTTVLDPFCGGGGILCEALLIGAKVIGIDMNWRLLKGAQTNLTDITGTEYTLLQSDARTLPIKRCGSIVTDPPYGRASSTRGAIAKQLISSTLTQSVEILESNGTLCICGSTELDISSMIDEIGVTRLHHIEVPVHRRLTREIISARI